MTFGIAVVGATGLWREYTAGERAATAVLCLMTGLGLMISVSIALSRRRDDVPWVRIAAIVVLLLLSFAAGLVRRNLILAGV